jgi:hypothetical protein
MTIKTAAGSKFYISGTGSTPSVPGSSVDTSTEYAALTWIEVGEVQNLGRFGDKANIVQFASLSDARVRKIKGSNDAGTIALVCGRDPFDVGQLALATAADTTFDYGFKVVIADNLDANDTKSTYYFQGPVNGAEIEAGSVDNVVTFNAEILINTAIVKVLSTVVT